MSIKPVDMQIVVQKAYEVAKNAASEQTRPNIQQQQFSQILQKDAAKQENQVLNTFNTSFNKVSTNEKRKDKRNSGDNEKAKEQQEQEQQQQEDKQKELCCSLKGRHVDIKI
ncbi:MAG: hypothetical protein PHP06_03825 [Clostridia bacterium]|nr:hypothetical protein [Clostridia bacterium]